MNARQMGGKRATSGAVLLGMLARPHWVMLVVGGFGCRNGLLNILKRQLQLVRIELLRPAAKLHALQLMQQVLQAVILRQHLVTLGNRRIALCACRNKERLQRRDISGKLVCALAHAVHRIRFVCGCEP
jgi:hypothetical protein